MSHDASALPRDANGQTSRAILMSVGICFIATVGLGLLSNGVHHDDDLVHFLMARWSWWYPEYLLHVWGRPGLTAPMALVAGWGDVDLAWHLSRVLSAIVSAASALLAAQLALRLGVGRRWRVVVACYLQPLFFVLGFTTLTENFTAFYLIAAVALLDRGNARSASVVFSLALLTRHEALLFVPIWLFALAWRRKSVSELVVLSVMTIWAPIAHNLLFRVFLEDWPFMIFLQPTGSTQYLATGWGAYIPDAIYAFTPWLAVLAVVGGLSAVPVVWTRTSWADQFLRSTLFLLVVIPAAFFLAHAVITATGVYGSGGFGRFMVAIAPFVAVLAVMGWDRLCRSSDPHRRIHAGWSIAAIGWLVIWLACESELTAGRLPLTQGTLVNAGRVLLASLVVLCLVMSFSNASGRARSLAAMFILALTIAQVGALVRPLRLNEKQLEVARVTRELARRGLADRPFMAADAWFTYGLGLIENPRALKNSALLASMPVGSIVIWDSVYSGSDYHGLSLSDLRESGAYVERPEWAAETRFLVYEKTEATPIPQYVKPSYPPPMGGQKAPIRGIYYRRERARPAGF